MATIVEYYSRLIPALADRFKIPAEGIEKLVFAVEDDFKSFGKFTTREKLDKGVKNALSKGKYCNVSTCVMHDDTVGVRAKYDLYSSGVSGVRGSEELKQALRYYPGRLVNRRESELFSQYTPIEPQSTTEFTKMRTIDRQDIDETLNSIVMYRHHVSGVVFIHEGMFAYDVDEGHVYGTVDMRTGNVTPLDQSHVPTLERRGFRYVLPEEDEGPEDGVCEYTEIIASVVEAIRKL